MPCKKNQQPPSLCPSASRRLLESLAIRDLPQTGVVGLPSLNRGSDPCPIDCGPCACVEDDCTPGTCCALNREFEISSRPLPGQDLAKETYLPTCKSVEVETMIDEMKKCHEIIRTLALEAMEILHSEHVCPICKQVAQAQNGPLVIGTVGKGPRCEYCNDTKVIESADQQYQGTESQSSTRYFAAPSSPLESGSHSRTSSVPIAQTAFQIKEGRLPKADDIEDKFKQRSKTDIKASLKRDKSDIDIEESLKKKSETEFGFDPYQEESKSWTEKITSKLFGTKPSACSCDGKNPDIKCASRDKVECHCGAKKSSQRLFGKKPSICSCKEDPKMQNDESEGMISKTCIKKIFRRKNDCVCPEDKDKMKEQSKANGEIELRKSGVQSSFGLPKCDKDICQCHFPPSYDQFFTCTGQVTGNCSCKKNV